VLLVTSVIERLTQLEHISILARSPALGVGHHLITKKEGVCMHDYLCCERSRKDISSHLLRQGK